MKQLLLITGLTAICLSMGFQVSAASQPAIETAGIPILSVEGLTFKDLKRNGKLDRYEDWRLSDEVRARDLVRQMTLAEKAGMMVHGTVPAISNPMGAGTAYDLAKADPLISKV